jgi:PAS domain S-box-containing protein
MTEAQRSRAAGLDALALPELTTRSDGLSAQAALLASGHAFAVTDTRLADDPLVWVNPAFEELTGYSAAESLGRNCRFLQGPDTDPAAVTRLRDALRAGRSVTETLLNYRADGSMWWNEVTITPVHDAEGALTHFVGVQSDVGDRIRAGHQRDDARRATTTAHERLALLATVGSMLADTLDPLIAARRLTRLLIPGFADWCSILLLGAATAIENQTEPSMTLAHRRPELSQTVADILAQWHPDPIDNTPQATVLRTGRPLLLTEPGPGHLDGANTTDDVKAAWRRLGADSCLIVPLSARGQRIGCLTLAYVDSGRRYESEDLEFAEDLSRRASTALETARLYTGEHRTALALQRSMLPAIPRVAGLEFAARYLPGSYGAEIGGDWFDVLPLPDGSTGLAVGDVMGHDIRAAAAMGQLRSVLRSYAWEGHTPEGVLDRLNQLVTGLGMAQLATCIYARIEPSRPGQSPLLRWSNAGHTPPLLKTPDGAVHLLEEGRSALIGVDPKRFGLPARVAASRAIPPGSALLLYTDGLIEVRDRDLDDSLAALRATFAAADQHQSVEDLADLLMAASGADGREDDRCLLLARVL